eukprot:gb/GEZN01011928.1/.p1 GENE.gb/GEZN01011928.1/~~gb/GEZN01011928.1/.p1  ORF type:complete len:149 (-),score=37.83 gb/GEZN01011928.1/:40-486(-)
MMAASDDEEEKQTAEPISKPKAAVQPTATPAPAKVLVSDITAALEALDLKDDKDFKELARKIATRVKASQKDNRKQLVFLKELTAQLTEPWSSEEFNSLLQSCTVIANSKKKDGGKKKKTGGAVLKTDKGGATKSYDDYSYDEYGDFI